MVPFIDMLNHQRPKKSLWNYSDEKEGFIIESFCEYERGLEVFDSYGNKCNKRFLLNYGFIENDNENNEYTLFSEDFGNYFGESVPNFNEKFNLLDTVLKIRSKSEKNENSKINFKADFDCESFRNMISIFRFLGKYHYKTPEDDEVSYK